MPGESITPDFVVLGKILGPWGVKGWVRIHPFADDPLAWKSVAQLSIGPDAAEGARQHIGLVDLRPHGDGLIAKFEGADDRTGAEALAGQLVGARRDQLPATSEGEYYWGDLIGLRVRNPAGDELGVVGKLLETGGSDVLVVVAPDRTERLIPFVAAVVLSVDPVAREIVAAWELDW